MAYNADKILDLDNLISDDKLFLADLQGNILKGHGRDHVGMLFFTIDPNKLVAAKADIKAFPVTSAQRQLDETAIFKASGGKNGGGLFRAFFLSNSGYVKLKAKAPTNPAFLLGAKKSAPSLNDTPVNTWDTGFQADLDGMFLLAHDDLATLTAAMMDLRKEVQAWTTPNLSVTIEEGIAYRNAGGEGIEHFGYLDGRSQPLMIKQDLLTEQYDKGGISVFDPQANMTLAVVPDPLGTGANGTSFGSYFVFRKLEQNVKGFLNREDDLSRALGLFGGDFDRGGAMVVGRFEDGTPIAMSDEDGQTDPVSNNFNYSDDPSGLKCPFQGHVRKTNPRNGGIALTSRMARRGITYGRRVLNADLTFADRPEKDVGLLFMAYQKSIDDQFEFIQKSWANNPSFPAAGTGIDPIIGQPPTNANQNWQAEYGGGGPTVPLSINGFVKMKGGEYFFAPSLSGIQVLTK